MSENTGSPGFSQDYKPANISALHEIDDNTLYSQRELPDSGKVELLDGSSPSGSGNEISEMPQSPTPAPLCELGTRHTSIASSILRKQSDRNRCAIIVKNGILRESVDSSRALKAAPCVETVISSLPRCKPLNLDRPLPTPPEQTFKYMNRALPSIPNSDRPQISPIQTSSSSRFSSTNCIHSLSSGTSVAFSETEIEPPETALDMILEDYDMSWESHRGQEPSPLSGYSTDIKIMMVADRQIHEYPSMSSLWTDVENAAPPGASKSQTRSSARSRKEERSPPDNFF